MRICMFTNVYLPHVGGVAQSVFRFTRDLRSMGNRVMVVTPSFPDDNIHDQDESDVVRMPAIQEFNGSDFSVRLPTPFFIDEKIDAFDPEIIHSHHPYFLGDSALRAARRRNLPLIFTHHTRYEQYTHYVTQDSESMKRFAAMLSTEYANLCDTVVTPSESIAELITDRGVRTPIEVIPTGVDISKFSSGDGKQFRKEHQIPDPAFVIGHVGRLAPEKNLIYLAKAAALAVKDNPDAVFVVVGSGPSEPDIAAIFREHHVSEQLIMTGTLSGEPLSGAYDSMDIFIFSSRSETQGMVLAEAMAAGNPVIALDAPGAREVVKDGENGRLLPGDTPDTQFAAAVKKAVKEKQKTDNWRKQAEITANLFSTKLCAQKLYDLYEAVIEETAGSEKETPGDGGDKWNVFLLAVEAEWNLIAEKAKAVAGTLKDN